MKHYSSEDWIDFVRATGSPAKQQEMQQHLGSACEPCKKIMSLWQKVRETATEDLHFQPPAEVLRIVKAAFGGPGMEIERHASLGEIVVELLFDSFKQPAFAGARSTTAASRQMLFRANPYQIDVNIECKPGVSLLSVTGQLLDLTRPDSFGRDISVTLTNRRGQTIQMFTNAYGEFSGELENRGDLELSFPGPGDKPVVVSLADALGHLSTDTRMALKPSVHE